MRQGEPVKICQDCDHIGVITGTGHGSIWFCAIKEFAGVAKRISKRGACDINLWRRRPKKYPHVRRENWTDIG